MNGIEFVYDTNIFIYIIKGNPNVAHFSTTDAFSYSVISRLELLGKFKIAETEKQIVSALLSLGHCFELDDEIQQKTIELKQKYKLKLPDAIIAASAIQHELPLVNADKGFAVIKELDFIQVEL
jgi:predicted nucleic acid-binding protein